MRIQIQSIRHHCCKGVMAFDSKLIQFIHCLFQEVNMNLAKFDELDVLIKGILFAETHNPTECYYFENASKIE